MGRRSACPICCLAVLAACFGRPAPQSIDDLLALAESALRNGQIDEAAELVGQARRWDPRHIGAARWSAIVAELLWHDDDAIVAQTAAIRLARAAGDEGAVAHLQGRLGDLLFQAGRWGQSAAPLLAGASAGQARRRQAFAVIASALPFVRRFTGPLVTEQPLLAGDAPEFVCGTRDRLRPFAIDTGTSMTTVAATFAEELGVRSKQPAGEALDSAGRALSIEVGLLPEFRIGDVDIGAIPVLVVDDSALRLRDLHGGPARVPRGVLGLDLLSACRLTVDPERGSVVLELSFGLSQRSSVQCVRVDSRCLVPVMIEGTRLWFVLDTGASHSSLSETGVERLSDGAARAVPSFRRVRTVGGVGVAVRELRGLVLRCSEARFLDVTLPVVTRGESTLFPVHGVLGVDLLCRCRLTLDRGRARLTALP